MASQPGSVANRFAKYAAILGLLCLLVPVAAWAHSSASDPGSSTCFPGFVCVYNQGGMATGGTAGLTMNGSDGSMASTVVGVGSMSVTGTLTLTTGALLAGSLSGCANPPCVAGTFGAGTLTITVNNWSNYSGTLFSGTFGSSTAGITWEFNGTIGTGKNKVYQYELTGPITGSWENGALTVNGQTAQLYFTTKTPFSGGSITLSSGTTSIVTPEPGTMGLFGTGLVGMGLIVRSKARRDRNQAR